MPPKALNPRSLLFVTVREMLPSTKMGRFLWNYQKDKIVKGKTFHCDSVLFCVVYHLKYSCVPPWCGSCSVETLNCTKRIRR